MKIWLTFAMFLCLMLVSMTGLSSQQDIDEKTVTNACFDKLFKDIDTLNKDYHRIEFENDTEESLRNHRIERKEKVYEYELIKGTMMRRLVSSNEKIYDSDREFKPFDRDIKLDRSFFDRFEYYFKQRITKRGYGVLIYQFIPKPNLTEDNYFYRVVNKLTGEIEIREIDRTLLAFRANIPSGVEVRYAQPPFAGVTVQSATVFVETADWEGMTLLNNTKIEVNYSISTLFFTSHFQHTKIIELKATEKIKKQNEETLQVSSEVSKDHELSDSIWRTRTLVLYLVALGILILVTFFALYKIRKNKNLKPR